MPGTPSNPASVAGGQVPVPGSPSTSKPRTPETAPGTVTSPGAQPVAGHYPPSDTPSDIARGQCDRGDLIPGLKNQDLGRVVGGILGGVLGSQVGKGDGNTLATIGGVLAGALAGGMLAESMSGPDYACASRALEYAPPGESITWKNPDEQSQYAMTPGETYRKQEEICRDYTLAGSVQGESAAPRTGTACRQPDGRWKVTDF